MRFRKVVEATLILLAVLAMGYALWGQEKKYQPTEVQLLRLQVTQKDAQLLQAQLQNVQRQFQEKVSQLMQEANKVKLEQGWPPETQFDPDKLQFSAPPSKEEKKQ